MRLMGLRRLNGPNVFAASPATVARLELDELTGRETTDFPGLADRLTRLLPGLAANTFGPFRRRRPINRTVCPLSTCRGRARRPGSA